MVLRLDIATEDEKPVKVKIEVKQSKPEERVLLQTVSDVLPGLTEVAISGASDGDYYVYFASPGYSPQFRYFTVEKGKIEKPERKVTLFRKRYVVLHYAFNMRGGREFSGKNVEEGRAAVSQWGTLPYFGEDWQIWQKSLDGAMFGDTPFLEFHRHATGFGFAEAPKGVPFDELKEAPVDTKYKCENKRAKAGLTLFCRVEGNNDEGLGYGKLLVEDVTETPPPGIKVIEYK